MPAQPNVKTIVARGAKWLDANKPEWWREGEIELAILDLEAPCECILGQLDGEFYESCYRAGLGRAEAQRFGFTRPDGMPWTKLTAEWKRVICERRAHAQPA